MIWVLCLECLVSCGNPDADIYAFLMSDSKQYRQQKQIGFHVAKFGKPEEMKVILNLLED